MKKSNKTNKETNIDEVLAEVEQAISKINNINELNESKVSDLSEKKLNKDIDLLETKLKLKYKDLLEDLTKK